jgi:hypothetical protein
MSKETIAKLLNGMSEAGKSAKTDDFSKAIEAMEKKLKAVQKKELAQGSNNQRVVEDKKENGNIPASSGKKTVAKKSKPTPEDIQNQMKKVENSKGKQPKDINNNTKEKVVVDKKSQPSTSQKQIVSGKKNAKPEVSKENIDKMKVMKQTETNIPKKSKKSDKNSNAN